jgi:hypothetical protein
MPRVSITTEAEEVPFGPRTAQVYSTPISNQSRGNSDVILEGLWLVLQALIVVEAERSSDAGRYDEREGRQAQRNLHRDRLLVAKAGGAELASQSSAREASFRASWSVGVASTERFPPSSWRPRSTK